MKKLVAAALLAALLFSGCESPLEDSDKLDNSTTPSLTDEGYNDTTTALNVSLNDTITTTIYPYSDFDYFRLSVDKPGLLSVSTINTPSDMRPIIGITNHKSVLLSESLAPSAGSDFSSFETVDTGTYYIYLSNQLLGESTSPISISFQLDSMDTLEPNNSLDSACTVTLGNTYSTKLLPSGDQDFYKITLNKGHLLRVSVDSIPSNLRGSIKFYNNKGTLIDSYSSSIAGTDFTGTCLVDSGTYYISLEDAFNKASESAFFITFSSDSSDALEYNNSIEDSYPITLGETYSTKLMPENDVDYFKLTLTEGHLLRVIVKDVPAKIRTTIKFYDSKGVLQSSLNASKTGDDFTATSVVDSGTYYISIEDFYGYSSDDPFQITFASDTNDTLEYNDKLERAQNVTLGETYSTKLMPAADVDYFKLTLDKGHLLRVTSHGIPSNLRPTITLFDDRGVQLTSYTASKSGADVTALLEVDSGTYHISLEDFYTYSSDTPFHISFTSDEKDTIEYNNTIEKAFPLTSFIPQYTKLATKGDIDYFSFNLDVISVVSIKTAGIDPKVRPSIELFKDGVSVGSFHAYSLGTELDFLEELEPGSYAFALNSYYTDGYSDKPFHVILKAIQSPPVSQ